MREYTIDGWEAMKKGGINPIHALPESSASVRKNCINISKDLRYIISGYIGAEVFINEQKRLIGMKPSNDKTKGFRIKDGIVAVNIKKFPNEKGVYEAKWNGEMLVIYMNNRRQT